VSAIRYDVGEALSSSGERSLVVVSGLGSVLRKKYMNISRSQYVDGGWVYDLPMMVA